MCQDLVFHEPVYGGSRLIEFGSHQLLTGSRKFFTGWRLFPTARRHSRISPIQILRHQKLWLVDVIRELSQSKCYDIKNYSEHRRHSRITPIQMICFTKKLHENWSPLNYKRNNLFLLIQEYWPYSNIFIQINLEKYYYQLWIYGFVD